MSDVMTEDDDLEIVEVDEAPADEPEVAAPEPEQPEPEASDDDDDDEDGDERLGDSEDESEEDIVNRNRVKRQKRRQARKDAQARLEAEVRALREANAAMINRLSAVEGVSLAQQQFGVDQKLGEAQRKIEQAEHIIARAVEAGNGADVAAAIRLRDEAISEAQQVKAERDRLTGSRTPEVNPLVKSYAKQWMESNPWYNPNGADEASQIANRIDRGLIAEGYDPTTRDYFAELTRRVEARFASVSPPAAAEPPARKPKAPPMGATREHAPATTKRNQVYVTPERRAALEELGVWDDPVARNAYLKEYARYDREKTTR